MAMIYLILTRISNKLLLCKGPQLKEEMAERVHGEQSGTTTVLRVHITTRSSQYDFKEGYLH